MKNLKKVLALVLVVAMMASFAVGASAAFTDEAEISYTTAVEALTNLGVINGYTDGSFRPSDSVSRGAFAKMVSYVLNGGTNAAASYGAYAAAAFSDVSASYTFANSIGYVVSKGIVSGYSDGTYRSGNNISGVAAAKILLGALGYSSDYEGYTGTGWNLNVLNDAADAGLLDGLDSVDMSAALTREEAAQMIWNALRIETVAYSGGSGITITTPDGVTVETANPTAAGTKVTLAEKAYKAPVVKGTAAGGAFGRPTVTYTLDNEEIASEVATPVLTYTNAVTGAKIYSDLGASKTLTIASYTDGVEDTTAASVAANAKDNVAGAGAVTEVYKTDTNTYTVVVINTYFDTVKLVKTSVPDPTTGVSTTTLTLTGGLTTEKFTDFAKKTAVLYTKDNGEIASLEAADTISGTLTKAVNNSKYTIGGAVYVVSSKSTLTDAAIVADMGKTVSYYVDSYDNLIAAVEATVAATAGTYIKVLAAETPSQGNYLNPGNYTGKVYGILSDGGYGECTVNYGTSSTKLDTDTVYEYTVNTAGELVIDADTPTTVTTTDQISAGATSVDGNILNSNTKFIFYTQSTTDASVATLTVKTGNTNSGIVPAGAVLVVENSVVIVAYVGGTYSDGSSVVDAAYVDVSTKGTTTTVEVVNGVNTTVTEYTYTAYTADGETLTLTIGKEIAADGVYKYNDDGTIGDAVTTVTGTLTVFGSTLKVGDNTYNYDANMVCFLGEDSALADGQTVVAIASNGTLTHIWVTTDAPEDAD